MSDKAITEAAARALFASEMPDADWEVFPSLHDKYRAKAATIERVVETVLTAATPLIEAAALERAARELEEYEVSWSQPAAAAIRALKEQP